MLGNLVGTYAASRTKKPYAAISIDATLSPVHGTSQRMLRTLMVNVRAVVPRDVKIPAPLLLFDCRTSVYPLLFQWIETGRSSVQ